jgi:hypothetical protein
MRSSPIESTGGVSRLALILVAGLLAAPVAVFSETPTLATARAWESPREAAPPAEAATPSREAARSVSPEDAAAHNRMLRTYCMVCHNDRMKTGNMTLAGFDAGNAPASPDLAEKMVSKLRLGMMPPPGSRRPAEEVLTEVAGSLEAQLDESAAAQPNPGRRSFQRLNRAEYTAAIRDLLALDLDAAEYLPQDTISANFDNIADVQLLSATLMDSYLRAASEISRFAVGDPNAAPAETSYFVSRWSSQRRQVEGAPYGTRGGLAVDHTFPADGNYVFRVSLHHEVCGPVVGTAVGALNSEENPEQLELSIDGERVALLSIDPWMHTSDPDGATMITEPIFVKAGPRRLAAAFLRQFDGVTLDLISPHEWSLASTNIALTYGIHSLPHLRDVLVRGPFDTTGVSETPSRQAIFTCRPLSAEETRPCAEQILGRLGRLAYRGNLGDEGLAALMALYDRGAETVGFEEGIRMGVEGILASPNFVFRIEEPLDPREAEFGYRLTDTDLASRLSFFLWGTIPDAELLDVAEAGQLSDPAVFDGQVRRMLEDPRSEALAKRFAYQWFRLQDLKKINPNVRLYPDFHQQLKTAMVEETERFFHHLVSEDRSVFDLFTADYTFVNERLAKHYGMVGVTGPEHRLVPYQDESRRGIFAHGSMLTLTSHPYRTSAVLRGKWVMEVLLGSPPPPPPPDVPDLDATAAAANGRELTARERLEIHRDNPACRSCHRMMDPIGVALEAFDVTGRVRVKDAGQPIDASGEFYDGTLIQNIGDLRNALLKRPTPLLRTFTENLMAYALGRRVEYYDQPRIREIVREAEASDYRMSSFILGVVNSPAFQMKGEVLEEIETTVAAEH